MYNHITAEYYIHTLAHDFTCHTFQRQQIVWIFNSKASLMQSGQVDVKERPYGKGEEAI